MNRAAHAHAHVMIEPRDDSPVRLDDLPPAKTTRWVIRRKAAVVEAVNTGLISLDEACRRYTLSEEEFHSWVKALERHGLRGLRVTRLQQYRSSPEHPE